jgi:Chromosome segregation ATPases
MNLSCSLLGDYKFVWGDYSIPVCSVEVFTEDRGGIKLSITRSTSLICSFTFWCCLMTNICFKSPPPISAANNSSGTTGTISEEHIRASLLSAVEDKLRRRLREQFSQIQAELETLRRTEQELSQGKDKLDDILARLEKEQVRYDRMIILK